MIKVVRSGVAMEEFYFKCYKCYCYFTATKGDAFKIDEHGSTTIYYLKCPECNQEVVRNDGDLAYHAQKSLKGDLGLFEDEGEDCW